jgi:hypothetical protein
MSLTSPVEPAGLVEQFQTLAARWKTDTALLSSTSAMIVHPAYQGIIALGPAVVPLLLQELRREPVHWFEALKAITGEDPVQPEAWGKSRTMADAWLAWGHSRGLI